MEILHFEDLGIKCHLAMNAVVLFPRRVSNFNSKVPQWDIYPHIKFERDRLNIVRVKSVHVVWVDTASYSDSSNRENDGVTG